MPSCAASGSQALEYGAPQVLPFLGEAVGKGMQGPGRSGLQRLGRISSKEYTPQENYLSAGPHGNPFLSRV